MTRWMLALAVVVGSLGAPSQAEACTCAPPDVVQSWRQHDHAFVGRVVGRRVVGGWQVYDVRVLQTAKSCLPEGRVIQVGSRRDSAACGASFAVGRNYLIFANDDEVGGRRVLTTHSCAANKPAGQVSRDEIAFLASRELSCRGQVACADGAELVNCFADPCSMSSCGTRGAVCEANYCGGCTAEWYTPSDHATCLPW